MNKEKLVLIIGILAMGMVLVPQIAHSLYLFEINSPYQNPWSGRLYAVGVDLAIFVFTIKGWLKIALIYMFVTLVHNLMYAFAPQRLWSNVLISIVQSLTLFGFTHLFLKREVTTKVQTEVCDTALKIDKAIKAGIHFLLMPFECPEYAECFNTTKQLHEHISPHKARHQWMPKIYGIASRQTPLTILN